MPDKKQIIESSAFRAQKTNYQIWEDFCTGGDAVEKKPKYLPRHPFESEPQYKIRLALSTYKNHAKPIVSVFTSSVWRKKPVRDHFPETLKPFLDNVDQFKTSADMFFTTVDQRAAETGLCFILVDSTKAPEDAGEIKTQADANKYGIRPFFVHVPALSVVAWGFDAAGLAFSVIKHEHETATDPFIEPKKTRTYNVWYRDKWELYEEKDKDDLVMTSQGTHPCKAVPLVPCYFRKKDEMVGTSAISEVLSLLSRAYNLENAFDKSLFDTAFPQQAFYGFETDSITNYIKSSSNGIVSPDSNAKSEFVEPSGRAFEAMDKKIKNDELSIREIALRMVRPDSKVGESAESKKLDNQQLNSQLSVFSNNCQDAETRCWELAMAWMNTTGEVGIKYNDDFDIDLVTGDLIRAFSEMRRNKDISRATLWKMMQKAEIPLPEDFDADTEAELIAEEARSSGTMGELGNRFLTGTGV